MNLRSTCPATYIVAMKCSLGFKLSIFKNHISIAISIYEEIQCMFVLCTHGECTVTRTS